MPLLHSILAIAVGASMGAICRWGLGQWLNHTWPAIPPGTLLANLIGGYFVGFALAWFAVNPESAPQWRLLVVTGFLGSLTTFSTFSAEVTTLLQQGRLVMAGGAISLHVVGSLLMTMLGLATVEGFRRISS